MTRLPPHRSRHPADDGDGPSRLLRGALGRNLAMTARAAGVAPPLVAVAALVLLVTGAALCWLGMNGFGLLALALALVAACALEAPGLWALPAIGPLATGLVAAGWAQGLPHGGGAYERVFGITLVLLLVAAQAARAVIAWRFSRRYRFELHRWRLVDRRARLLLAGPGTLWLLLALGWLAGRADRALEWVALWAIVSLIWDMVRLANANDRRRHRRPVELEIK